ncbi:MAG: HDOD domain-containing protein [Thermodesulfobacteriota bacterium]|nr:HDOD domain-containing protein [Thermodesulfobacteriota bacterium]
MDSHAISTLTASIDSFPTLPTVVNRVMDITADPESSAEDLMHIIRPDQSLTTTILKMANSAFFGQMRKVSSLQKAIIVLGFSEVRNIILAKAVFNSFKNLNNGGEFDIRKHWEHSFVCGLVSQSIAEKLEQSCGDFFVAGLLHDIGRLLMHLALPSELSNIIKMTGHLRFMMFHMEEEKFGISHDEVGMRLLKRWFFPETLLTAVGYHHRPYEEKTHILFSRVVYVADRLTHLLTLQENKEADKYLKRESIYPEIISIIQSMGKEWNNVDLDGFLLELSQIKKEEAGTFDLFFS